MLNAARSAEGVLYVDTDPLPSANHPLIPTVAGLTPALTLDLRKEPLDARVTFSRSTIGTYFDVDGLMKTAAINAPRFAYNPYTGVAIGLMLETATFNNCLNSEDFTAATWTKTFSGAGSSAPIITAGYAKSPTGATDATRLQMTIGALATDTCQVHATTVMAANDRYTHSIFLRTTAPGVTYQLILDFNGMNSSPLYIKNYPSLITVTSEWNRFQVRLEPGYALTTGGLTLRLKGDGGTDKHIDVLVWGAQSEQKEFATSYIKVVAAPVTRTADVARMTGTNFSSWFNPTLGTMLFQVTPMWYKYGNDRWSYNALSIDDGLATPAEVMEFGMFNVDESMLPIYNQTNGGVLVKSVGNWAESTTPVVQFQPVNVGLVYSAGSFAGGNYIYATNGALPNWDNYTESYPVPAPLVRLNISNLIDSDASVAVAFIQYWPVKLTQAQLLEVTKIVPVVYPYTFNQGLAYAQDGRVYSTEELSALFANGLMVSPRGQLVVAPNGVIAGAWNGFPRTASGALVTTADNVPLLASGFSHGFSTGFGS